MPQESSRPTAPGANPTSNAGGTRVLIIADDYQFLDTIHGHIEALRYEYIVAVTRERIIEGAQPEPLAILIDLQMRSLDPLEAVRLLDVLGVRSKVAFLNGEDMGVVAAATRLINAMNLKYVGLLSRPVSINSLMKLLDRHAVAAPAITSDELRTALEQQQLALHYQPIIVREGKDWAIRAVEALLRWQHPQRGMIFPGQFLGVAASEGLMEPLTDWVMTEAVRQTSEWGNKNLDLSVTVNMSPTLVRDAGFVDRLMGLLKEFDLEPSKLMLEMIEAASVRDRELVRDAMMRLRLQGVGLSLDDFGTGHSSLTELCALPYTELKIDRSLTNGLPAHREAATIVEVIIDLAHRLSIRACAEGVETAQVFSFLEQSNCDAMQGMFIAKPMAAADILKLIQSSPIWKPPA